MACLQSIQLHAVLTAYQAGLVAQTCPDPEAFKADLSRYFVEIQKEQEWVETNGADAMSAVLELVRRHKVPMLPLMH